MRMGRGVWVGALVSALVWGGAAQAASKATATKKARPVVQLADRALWRAKSWVGMTTLAKMSSTVTDDCSGMTRLAFQQRRLDLLPDDVLPEENGVTAIHRKARALGMLTETPTPGALVFFKDTFDKNRDGLMNDGLTHIGIVERVGADGTVTFVHKSGGLVKRSRFNLVQPEARKDAKGHVLNDWLRRKGKKTRGYLAGELVAGFASVDERWRSPEPPRLASAKLTVKGDARTARR
ncbi:CHAP domain-containing protein [Corallococcus sp. AS-1-12]|uniref:CHAP domain-containing protein n=1 Tax=Corallococcus sp. AS-1-12 TaxID=2874598 RepID=UPI001CC00AD7|nr:CHAP domain-containing protein [Corallococcus sp. AS-1-12]MBZ4332304.1 CHAP domain-containing protein [Corallococcus sp. AS-1-12]